MSFELWRYRPPPKAECPSGSTSVWNGCFHLAFSTLGLLGRRWTRACDNKIRSCTNLAYTVSSSAGQFEYPSPIVGEWRETLSHFAWEGRWYLKQRPWVSALRMGEPEYGPCIRTLESVTHQPFPVRPRREERDSGARNQATLDSAGTSSGRLYLHSVFGHCATGPAFRYFSIR
jgi:hypothetical protein